MKQHPTGFWFPDADVHMWDSLRPDGSYQRDNYEAARPFITNWSCAVDAGSHCGTWTRWMARDFGHVLAFEPAPDTYEALLANIEHFGMSNVESYNVALGHRRSKVALVLDAKHQQLQNTGARHISLDRDADRTVRVETLDSFELDTLGFLKADVEGSELFVLQGAEKTINRCKPVILHENKRLWMKFGIAADGPQTWLEQHGYRFAVKAGCDAVWVPR
jgi:methyltransferase, FkbM family